MDEVEGDHLKYAQKYIGASSKKAPEKGGKRAHQIILHEKIDTQK